MIIHRDVVNRKKSIYECDRCKRKMYWKDTVRIFRAECTQAGPLLAWHFCARCDRLLREGVKKKNEEIRVRRENNRKEL